MIDLTGPIAAWSGTALSLWHDCLERALEDPAAWRTPPRTGLPRLRAVLADHLRLPADRLVITQGIRAEVASALAGAECLYVERPTFQDIARIAREHGVKVVSLTLEEMLAGDVADERAVLWVTSPARNPDGRTLVSAEVSRLDELAGACKRVVVNQAYHWAAPGAPRPQRALLLGSLHKLTGGGAAIGWRVGPDDPGPQRPSLGGPPRPWQSALAEFVDRGGLTELAAHGLTAACQRCRRFAEALTAFPCARLGYGDGPSIVLTVPSSLPQDAVVAEFAAADLAVGTGSSFGCPPTSVRLSFTGVNDADLQTCIQRTRQVLTRLLNRLDAAADCLLPIRDLGEWHARH